MKSKVLIILTIVVFTIFSINTSHAVSINLSKINESVKLALEDADKPINISKRRKKNQKSLLSLSSKFRNLKEDVQDKVLDVKEYLVNLLQVQKLKPYYPIQILDIQNRNKKQALHQLIIIF